VSALEKNGGEDVEKGENDDEKRQGRRESAGKAAEEVQQEEKAKQDEKVESLALSSRAPADVASRRDCKLYEDSKGEIEGGVGGGRREKLRGCAGNVCQNTSLVDSTTCDETCEGPVVSLAMIEPHQPRRRRGKEEKANVPVHPLPRS
jgi:hypothetical protein